MLGVFETDRGRSANCRSIASITAGIQPIPLSTETKSETGKPVAYAPEDQRPALTPQSWALRWGSARIRRSHAQGVMRNRGFDVFEALAAGSHDSDSQGDGRSGHTALSFPQTQIGDDLAGRRRLAASAVRPTPMAVSRSMARTSMSPPEGYMSDFPVHPDRGASLQGEASHRALLQGHGPSHCPSPRRTSTVVDSAAALCPCPERQNPYVGGLVGRAGTPLRTTSSMAMTTTRTSLENTRGDRRFDPGARSRHSQARYQAAGQVPQAVP